MKKRIYIKDWLDLKPYRKHAVTDSYYLQLANEVKTSLIENDDHGLNFYLNDLTDISCFLTSYFEDIISQTGVWNTFIQEHKKKYNKYLPFYNLDEYYPGEVNIQDVSFLIWYYINTQMEDSFIGSQTKKFTQIADYVFRIFEREYEYAPENELLQTYYKLAPDADYYDVRAFTDKLLFETYLFIPDTRNKVDEIHKEIVKNREDDEDIENIEMYMRDVTDAFRHSVATRLLAYKPAEWIVAILGAEHPQSTAILNMSGRISGYFFYKGSSEYEVFLEHIASGKSFNLLKESYDEWHTLDEHTLIFMGIVKWKEHWWFSGIALQTGYEADLILDQKNDVEARKQVAFLEADSKAVKETLAEQEKSFLAYNKGHQICFLLAENIDNFMNGFLKFHNDTLNLSKKEKEAAIKRIRKDGLFIDDDEVVIETDYKDKKEGRLVFYNPKVGIEVLHDLNNAFPMENNPYFDIDKSDTAIGQILVSPFASKELVHFAIEKGQYILPYFKGEKWNSYKNDLDFLLRFWKNSEYKRLPEVMLVG